MLPSSANGPGLHEHLEDDPTKRTANIALHIDREVAEWMGELAGEWKANRRAEPADRPDPVNVVERIRDVIFYTVRNQFDDFLWRSTAEERLLLHEVFQDHESSTREDQNELVLAYAFEAQVKGFALTPSSAARRSFRSRYRRILIA